ncbi:MAG: molybdopterin-guanine dinucleotide biosynthesis protein B [Peptococcaceae bacterium]|nr:molybdopterin-guanine dinucleotide biosynthesis protein B [Peptococcaceae bacterium]
MPHDAVIPTICLIAGSSNMGKTTFLEALIPELLQRKIRVACIKNDAHGFDMDTPGKDSWRFSQAGAQAVAVISPHHFAIIQKTPERASLSEAAAHFRNVDMILVEGYKTSPFPKIEIFRQTPGRKLALPKEDLLALITDGDPPESHIGLPIFALTDYSRVADFLIERFISHPHNI